MNTEQQRAGREELYGLLGDLPGRNRPIRATLVREEERAGYRLQELLLDLNGLEDVPAYLALPGDTVGRVPAVLFNHSHGGQYERGKEELLDPSSYMQRPGYAEELTRLGVATLCIDTWAFGGRRGRTETEIFKEMLWRGRAMWGMMVYDSLRALDYLVSRDDVDPGRIGTLGMSMGSTMAWWVAALDERVRVCVDICCLSEFEALCAAGGLDGHGVYYFVPSLLNHFSTARINALIAPRPHLGLAGSQDPLTPPEGLDKIDRELKKVYRARGAPGAWKLSRHDVAHLETPAMRAEALAFLEQHL